MISFSELFGEKDEIIYNGDRVLSIEDLTGSLDAMTIKDYMLP